MILAVYICQSINNEDVSIVGRAVYGDYCFEKTGIQQCMNSLERHLE